MIYVVFGVNFRRTDHRSHFSCASALTRFYVISTKRLISTIINKRCQFLVFHFFIKPLVDKMTTTKKTNDLSGLILNDVQQT